MNHGLFVAAGANRQVRLGRHDHFIGRERDDADDSQSGLWTMAVATERTEYALSNRCISMTNRRSLWRFACSYPSHLVEQVTEQG